MQTNRPVAARPRFVLTDMHGDRGVCVPVKPEPVRPAGTTLAKLFPSSKPR